ncbi:hypothetical protein GCM10027160_14580 [Streptomyces calidiresistens]
MPAGMLDPGRRTDRRATVRCGAGNPRSSRPFRVGARGAPFRSSFPARTPGVPAPLASTEELPT